ncbi:hypothetical protein C8F04DRAFT_1091194 [Mycena alexandri]|uniref:Transmembrane protein n=1 Tax=Mycena alexandri TaxID=1745969 RepID=A0AAD6T684_9AGAR|nr:hypothetical protein C8F04DRAFT_1091194 [Mycena alexandri]
MSSSINFTIDNVAPLIQYTPVGAWVVGSKTADPLASFYSNNGTFSVSSSHGSSATFVFNGTQVFIFGAKRNNHGLYSITLDSVRTIWNGYSATPIFSTLFTSDVLNQGLHTITLTNEADPASPYLDLDFITWSTIVTDGGGQSEMATTNSPKNSVVGGVVCGFLAGVLVIAALIFLTVFLRRRKRKWTEHAAAPGPSIYTIEVFAGTSTKTHLVTSPDGSKAGSINNFIFEPTYKSTGRMKGAPPRLSPTANVPLPSRAVCMVVPGREQDFGPLPPNYQQATESKNAHL